MADIEAQKKVETTVEEKKEKVEEKEKVVEKEVEKPEENGAKAENGDKAEKENEKESEEKETTTDKCCIKRKSTGGDATDAAAKDESTPEKKAKLDEAPAEAEANGEVTEAEVAA